MDLDVQGQTVECQCLTIKVVSLNDFFYVASAQVGATNFYLYPNKDELNESTIVFAHCHFKLPFDFSSRGALKDLF